MAAPSIVPTVPNTPLSNRNYEGNTNDYIRPPSGPCNYINVNVGGNVPKCGCQRFTDKSIELRSYGATNTIRPGWCICEHHSCYHKHDPVDGYRASGDLFIEDSRSLTPRPQTSGRRCDVSMEDVPEIGIQKNPEYLQDTVQWSRFVKSGSSQGRLPAIPSQCLLPSDNGSRASSSQTGYVRPFGGKGLHTLAHNPKPSNPRHGAALDKSRIIADNGKIMQIYQDSNGNSHLQSLTEVATPTVRSQDLDAELNFGQNVSEVQDALHELEKAKAIEPTLTVAMRPSDERSVSSAAQQTTKLRNDSNDNLLPKIRSIMHHVADYPMTKENHERRLDHLENASFSNPAVDQLRNDHDMLELRVDNLQTRMDEVEKQQMAASDTNSIGSGQHTNLSMDSRSSTALVASAIDRLDYARIETLEAQILELQSLAPPSHIRPWEVEVVFLPFGSFLKGIWSSSQPSITQLSRVNSASGDEWTQTQHNSMAAAQARVTANDQTVAWETSATDLNEHSSPWLMPKACGVGSLVDERLKSRGLVRRVLVKGPDARDVQAAIMTTFGDLPGILADDPYSDRNRDHKSPIPDSLAHYHGLRASWIPLRKVHKNSCLRFLNTSEMITPALWTVQFLSSSVAMRSTGIRRLYVTQSDSYLQNLTSTVSWTWPKIRQLDRVYSSPNTPTNHTPEADADEPCWHPNERYDTNSLPSRTPSFSSPHHNAHQPTPEPASPSDHFSSAPISPNTETPTTIPPPLRHPHSPLKERHPFRPLHTRTSSLPSLHTLPKPQKRPLQGRLSSPTHIALHIQAKRQRTRSPSAPRWSIGPPSPSPFHYHNHNQVQNYAYGGNYAGNHTGNEDFKRGTTPFAYATPHSNAPYVPRGSVGFEGDDEEDEEFERGSTTNDDEDIGWERVRGAQVAGDDEDEEDGERNALSDFGDDAASGGQRGSVELGVWEGVRDSLVLEDADADMDDNDNENHGNDGDMHDNDDESDGCPSEYPSRQPDAIWMDDHGSGVHGSGSRGGGSRGSGSNRISSAETKGLGFKIHVDEEFDVDVC